MSGVILSFGAVPVDGQLVYSVSVKSASVNLPNRPPAQVNLHPTDQVFSDLSQLVSDPNVDTPHVVNAGQTLFATLAAHANTASALPLAVNAPVTDPGRDLRVCLPDYDDVIRHLPWESLRDPAQGFLDNDLGLPVVRVIDPKPGVTRPSPVIHGDGLRIVSVIAAQGLAQDGGHEFKALYDALSTYGSPWTLRVYSPDQQVIDAIAAKGDNRVTHHHVPRTASELMTAVASYKPQICHLFCHGVTVGDGPARLELSSRGSMAGGSTVALQASQLASALPSSAWLVLLNACNSGAAPGDSGSLATALVENGVPVVVGMREPTQARTLHAFTEGFLGSALIHIQQALGQSASSPLALSPAITAARQAICATFRKPGGNPAERMKDWTLPVMFISADPFDIEPGTDNEMLGEQIAALKSERATLTDFLAWSDGQVSSVQLTEIQNRIAEIDKQVEVLRS